MADGESIFARAGFKVGGGAAPDPVNPAPAAPASAKDAASAATSIFEQAGLSTAGRSAIARHDDLEHATATGAKATPKKEGRGVWQAIKDYPGHLVQGAVDLFKAPGNLMKPNPYPEGSESWYWYEDQRDKGITSTGISLAGTVAGGEFPRVAVAPVAAKVGSSGRAINKLVEAVGPENVPDVVNALRENPRLSVADVSDPVRTMTQGLIDPSQPKVQNLVAETVKKRQSTLPEAVNSAYTEAMGPAPDVIQMVEGLKNRARDAGQKEIQPVLDKAKPVDVSPVVAAIDAKLKPGVRAMLDPDSKLPLSPVQEALARVKQQLVTETGEHLYDAKRLHEVQSEIGSQAYQYSKSPDPKDRMVGKQLRDINEMLVDQIDAASKVGASKETVASPAIQFNDKVYTGMNHADAMERAAAEHGTTIENLHTKADDSKRSQLDAWVTSSGRLIDSKEAAKIAESPHPKLDSSDPEFLAQKGDGPGPYRLARAKFKEAKDINEAFESGFDTLKNRQGLTGAIEDSPKALQKWMDGATPEEVVARRLGTRADIDQKIRTSKNQALTGEGITRIEYNRDKLKILFGDKEASRLIRVMEDAQKEAATNAKLLAGSKTAETLAGREALKVRQVEGGNPLSYAVPFMSEFLGTQYGIPGVGAAMMALKGGHLGTQKIGQMMDLARNYDFARNALATGYERQQTMNALLSHPKVVREIKKRSNALALP